MPLIAASDVVDLQAAITANADVAAATALQHARAHTLTSTADHSDVSGTPNDSETLIYSGGGWAPAAITAVADGGTY